MADIKNNYDDIINLPHHVSKVHKPMPISSRVAQFAPFAALTGYSDAIEETSRILDKKIRLDENYKKILDEKIEILKNNLDNIYTFTYFLKDKNKIGGKYIEVKGKVKKIDIYNKTIILENNTKIKLSDIKDINCDILEQIGD